MKKIIILLTSLFFIFTISAAFADVRTVTIINHFSTELKYELRNSPSTLPDLPINFSLPVGDQTKSRIVSSNECYIRVTTANIKKSDTAFWGIDASRGVRGYMGVGIAYSWNNRYRDITVTFCTPAEYAENGHC